MGTAAAAAIARHRQGIVFNGDALFMAGRMVDTDRRARCGAAGIPARPVRIGAGRYRLTELDQGEVAGRVGGTQGGARLRMGGDRSRQRRAAGRGARRAAGRTLIVPVHHDGIHHRLTAHTVIGGQEIRRGGTAGVADQGAGTDIGTAALAKGVVADGVDLVAPGIASRAGGVDIARARLLQTVAAFEQAAIAVGYRANLKLQLGFLTRIHGDFQPRAFTRYVGRPELGAAQLTGIDQALIALALATDYQLG